MAFHFSNTPAEAVQDISATIADLERKQEALRRAQSQTGFVTVRNGAGVAHRIRADQLGYVLQRHPKWEIVGMEAARTVVKPPKKPGQPAFPELAGPPEEDLVPEESAPPAQTDESDLARILAADPKDLQAGELVARLHARGVNPPDRATKRQLRLLVEKTES